MRRRVVDALDLAKLEVGFQNRRHRLRHRREHHDVARVRVDHACTVRAKFLVQPEMDFCLARQLAFAFEDVAVKVDDEDIFGLKLPLMLLPGKTGRHADNIADADADISPGGIRQVAFEQQRADSRQFCTRRFDGCVIQCRNHDFLS